MNKVILATDGSCIGNPGPGGWCAILIYGDVSRILQGNKKDTTNNQMELLSVIEGLKALKRPCEVELQSDSAYVLKGIRWLPKWKSNNWKTSSKTPVANKELWLEYLEVSKNHKITTKKILAHSGNELNEKCDKIAKEEAYKLT